MALKSGSLGTLLQGVNQQPARVRLPGQVEAQKNLFSDVTAGLGTRPSTTQGVYLEGATSNMKYTDIVFKGDRFIFGWNSGNLQVWDDSGVSVPVVLNGVSDFSYIGSDMRFHSVEDDILVLNREETVAKTINSESLLNVGLFHALGGQLSSVYSVTIEFEDGTTVYAEYETPDGSSNGHAALSTSVAIVRTLTDRINADPDLPVDTEVSRVSDVTRIFHPTLSFTITTSDDEAGEVLKSVSKSVQSVSDLPRYAPNGTVVQVVTSEADEDDYWLRFQAEDTTVVNGGIGFGKEGTWFEWYNPDQDREFDLTTMPHKLSRVGNSFEFSLGDWVGRSVGDEDTSPFPSILGKRVRDINGFESRVVLLGEDSVVMTRTNKPFDLWRESVTVLADTDPVDLTSTKKDSLRLDWLVPFDRDMFVIADPGDSQFLVRGGGITPSNASMVLTTEFEVHSAGTVPVSTGRTILLPFKKGVYSGVKEFYTESDTAANAADSLTEGQDRYIEGLISRMAVSQNFNLAVISTGDFNKTLWVYKYLWDQREILQSSWSKWEFEDNVLHMFFDGSDFTLLSSDASGVYLHVMDLDRPEGEFGYHLMLDRETSNVVSTEGYVDLPYSGASFQQSVGCNNPGLEVGWDNLVRVDATTWRYYLTPSEAPAGARVNAGQRVSWLLTPSEVYARDYQNNIDTSRKVTVQDYVVIVENSGSFKALGTSPYSDDWEVDFELYPFDEEPGFDRDTLTYSGQVTFPWGERADWSKVTFTGDDLRPVTILEVRWNGQVIKTKGRA